MTKSERELLTKLLEAQAKTSANVDNLAEDMSVMAKSLPTVIELKVRVESLQAQVDKHNIHNDQRFARIWKVFIASIGMILTAVFTSIWQGAK